MDIKNGSKMDQKWIMDQNGSVIGSISHVGSISHWVNQSSGSISQGQSVVGSISQGQSVVRSISHWVNQSKFSPDPSPPHRCPMLLPPPSHFTSGLCPNLGTPTVHCVHLDCSSFRHQLSIGIKNVNKQTNNMYTKQTNKQ